MATRSHARCRKCGRARHSFAKFNLCQTCWQQQKPAHRAAWAEMKARRANRRAQAEPLPIREETVTIEDTVTTETLVPEVHRRQRHPLSPEQEMEIIEAYTRTNESVHDIARRFGIRNTQPYAVMSKLDITWRRGNPESFDEWQASQRKTTEVPVAVPETKRELPPQIEAMRKVNVKAVPEPAEVTFEGDVWEITYTGRMLVKATTVDEALERARSTGQIRTIVGVNMRSRAS